MGLNQETEVTVIIASLILPAKPGGEERKVQGHIMKKGHVLKKSKKTIRRK